MGIWPQNCTAQFRNTNKSLYLGLAVLHPSLMSTHSCAISKMCKNGCAISKLACNFAILKLCNWISKLCKFANCTQHIYHHMATTQTISKLYQTYLPVVPELLSRNDSGYNKVLVHLVERLVFLQQRSLCFQPSACLESETGHEQVSKNLDTHAWQTCQLFPKLGC